VHTTTPRFRQRLERLPPAIRSIAEQNFHLLKQDPHHPSLHFKKVGDFWSVRIGLDYRALAMEDGPDFIWVWIGRHDEYKRMIRQS